MKQHEYSSIREEAERIYKNIGRIHCPALDDYVAFNNIGFNHLLRKRGVSRTKGEQLRRLVLIEHAEIIVNDPEATIDYREQKQRLTITLSQCMIKKYAKSHSLTFGNSTKRYTVYLLHSSYAK